jgi:hypothetical protein
MFEKACGVGLAWQVGWRVERSRRVDENGLIMSRRPSRRTVISGREGIAVGVRFHAAEYSISRVHAAAFSYTWLTVPTLPLDNKQLGN